MKGKIIITSVIIVLIIIISIFLIDYNRIVPLENQVEEAKAQVQVVNQRRLDLIPNLVEIVKGYAEHEKETLVSVIQARNNMESALKDTFSKQNLGSHELEDLKIFEAQLNDSLKELFVLVEDYPDLKAQQNFMALQDQLEGTENRIYIARQRYNSFVRIYNTKIATFPGKITSLVSGFKKKRYFEAKKEAEEPAKIDF